MPLVVLPQALASTLDSSDIADLRDQFNAIDIDRNGTITLEEMRLVSLVLFEGHTSHLKLL